MIDLLLFGFQNYGHVIWDFARYVHVHMYKIRKQNFHPKGWVFIMTTLGKDKKNDKIKLCNRLGVMEDI